MARRDGEYEVVTIGKPDPRLAGRVWDLIAPSLLPADKTEEAHRPAEILQFDRRSKQSTSTVSPRIDIG